MMEWNEKDREEIMKKINESADGLKIPESLEPSNIKKKLEKDKKKKKMFTRHLIEIAAAVVIVVLAGSYGLCTQISNQSALTEKSVDFNNGSGLLEIFNNGKGAEHKERKKKVGSYHLAANYREIYRLIKKSAKEYARTEMKVYDAQKKTGEELQQEAVSDQATTDYAKTNTMVEDIDEADIIKNDGRYLFLKQNEKIAVIDVSGNDVNEKEKTMKEIASIKPKMDETDSIINMYLDRQKIVIILQKGSFNYQCGIEDSAKKVYTKEEKNQVEIQTYDISNPKKAVMTGTVTMDGLYNDSRKAGDYIYVFSTIDTYNPYQNKIKNCIPEINGKKMKADHIYISQSISEEMIGISVNINDPEKIQDHIAIMKASGDNIYMGTDGIYLYSEDWSENTNATNIIKFSYKDGRMEAAGACKVKGSILDEFAISESNGILCVLTTELSKKSNNRLYLMDNELKIVGKLANIATGEEIYAARQIGNMIYFITYHNTDPLFAVDISDPSSPKMLGNVKMNGYAFYLHPYGKDRLLGIGYETDPETSETKGVKLVMYDISNPTKLKIIDSVIIKGDYCSAQDNYKNVLVNSEKNLIGFSVENYRMIQEVEGTGDSQTQTDCVKNETMVQYKVFKWDNDHFENLTGEQENNPDWKSSQVSSYLMRGIYIGNTFYLIETDGEEYNIKSFDINADFKKMNELKIRR